MTTWPGTSIPKLTRNAYPPAGYYLLDLLPARTVVLAFRLFDLKHE